MNFTDTTPRRVWPSAPPLRTPDELPTAVGADAGHRVGTGRAKGALVAADVGDPVGRERRMASLALGAPLEGHVSSVSPIPRLIRNTCPSGWRTCISRTFHGMSVGGQVTSIPCSRQCR